MRIYDSRNTTYSNMSTVEKVLRWIMFLPAGIIAMMLLAWIIRASNPNMPFISDLVVAFGEYWVFFAAALYIAPAHHKSIIVTCVLLLVIVHVGAAYKLISVASHAYSWPEILVDICLMIGIVTSARYHYVEYGTTTEEWIWPKMKRQ